MTDATIFVYFRNIVRTLNPRTFTKLI